MADETQAPQIDTKETPLPPLMQGRPETPILAPQPPAQPTLMDPRAAIWAHTAGIHNPVLRTLGRISGIAGTALTAASPAGQHLMQEHQQAELKLQQAQHQNEMADLKAQHAAELEQMREKAAAARETAGIAGRQKVAETQVAGREAVAEKQIAAKPTHTVEDLRRQAGQAFASGDMDLYKKSLEEIHDITMAGTAAAAKPRQEVTLQTPDGKRVAGFKGPEGLMLESGEKAPEGTLLYQAATTGQTRTATIWNPQSGFPEVMQYNPDTGRYDIPVGISPTGAAGGRMAQAAAVQRAGEGLIQDIQKHKDRLGEISTWVEKYGLNTPIADPELAGIQAGLGSFAALQPAMHGFRGQNALDTFEKIIGGLQKNPEATISSIRAIQKTTGALLPTAARPAAHGGQSFADWDKANQ